MKGSRGKRGKGMGGKGTDISATTYEQDGARDEGKFHSTDISAPTCEQDGARDVWRLAVYFGAFDPVHENHVGVLRSALRADHLAEAARSARTLDEDQDVRDAAVAYLKALQVPSGAAD